MASAQSRVFLSGAQGDVSQWEIHYYFSDKNDDKMSI